MYYNTVVRKEAPFSRKGGIETAFARQNRDLLGNFLKREFQIVQEDPAKSEFAIQQPLLVPHDDGIRHTKEGTLLVSTLRRSTNPDISSNTLVERWSVFDDPIHHDVAFDVVRAFREHIAGSYIEGGQQYENRQSAFKQANLLLNKFSEGPLTDYQRESLISSTKEAMAKYFSSPIPERLRTAMQFVKAIEKDAYGRSNQPRGRMILTRQRPSIINDRLIDNVILLKNLRRADIVDLEASFEDFGLEQSAELVNRASSISDNKSFNEFVDRLLLKNIHFLISPDMIKMKPYSLLASKLRFLLFAKKGIGDVANDDISMGLARYIGNDAYQFADKYPFFSSLQTTTERRKRLFEFSKLCSEELNKIRYLRENSPKEELKKARMTSIDKFWNRLDKLPEEDI